MSVGGATPFAQPSLYQTAANHSFRDESAYSAAKCQTKMKCPQCGIWAKRGSDCALCGCIIPAAKKPINRVANDHTNATTAITSAKTRFQQQQQQRHSNNSSSYMQADEEANIAATSMDYSYQHQQRQAVDEAKEAFEQWKQQQMGITNQNSARTPTTARRVVKVNTNNTQQQQQQRPSSSSARTPLASRTNVNNMQQQQQQQQQVPPKMNMAQFLKMQHLQNQQKKEQLERMFPYGQQHQQLTNAYAVRSEQRSATPTFGNNQRRSASNSRRSSSPALSMMVNNEVVARFQQKQQNNQNVADVSRRHSRSPSLSNQQQQQQQSNKIPQKDATRSSLETYRAMVDVTSYQQQQQLHQHQQQQAQTQNHNNSIANFYELYKSMLSSSQARANSRSRSPSLNNNHQQHRRSVSSSMDRNGMESEISSNNMVVRCNFCGTCANKGSICQVCHMRC